MLRSNSPPRRRTRQLAAIIEETGRPILLTRSTGAFGAAELVVVCLPIGSRVQSCQGELQVLGSAWGQESGVAAASRGFGCFEAFSGKHSDAPGLRGPTGCESRTGSRGDSCKRGNEIRVSKSAKYTASEKDGNSPSASPETSSTHVSASAAVPGTSWRSQADRAMIEMQQRNRTVPMIPYS